jgi:hypothetical protein
MFCIDARIKRLTEDLGRVNSDMNTLKDEFSQILKSRDKPNKSYPQHNKHVNSPTKIASPLHSNEYYTSRNDSEEVLHNTCQY